MTDSVRVRGIVKWFNSDKAFGFLVSEVFDKDIFVHRSQMVRSGVETLTEDEKCTFVVKTGPKGLFATKIKKESR
jgi:CspA family cold shock protein